MPSASADASGDRWTTRSTPRAPRRGRRAAGALVVGALALSLAGCFGSSSSNSSLPGADPASVVPSSALAYAQAVIRPTGKLARDINAASERLLGIANPGAQLDGLIDKSAQGGVSYEKSIRPWLGARAGVALLSVGSGHAEAVVVLDQTDDAKARAALSTHVLFQTNGKPDTTTTGSYRGVSYVDDQTAQSVTGVVGQFVVIANNSAAFDATVDVEKGASSLASAGNYQDSLGQTLSDSAGTAYAALGRLVALIPASGVASSALSLVKGLVGNEILYGSARFDASGALLDLGSLDAPKSSSSSPSTPETNPIGSLPADSWVAIGATNVGPSLLKGLASVEKLAGGGTVNLSQSLAEIQLATGINIQADLGSITTAGFFVDGASTASPQAALELGLTDPSRASTILGQIYKLATLITSTTRSVSVGSLTAGSPSSFTLSISGFPDKLVIAAASGKIIVALGRSSLSAAVANGPTLAGSAGFKGSGALLGSGIQPVAYVDLARFATLVQGVSPSTPNAVDGYLKRLGSVAIGAGKISGSEHVRVAVRGS
jgi:hypothetical protein